MQMHGQMARVPVTARQKFSEAAYFYNSMLPHRTNPVVFPYYLSAFVSALRSVTYYLQKQYAHDERFKEWYAPKQEAMKADPVLKMLHESAIQHSTSSRSTCASNRDGRCRNNTAASSRPPFWQSVRKPIRTEVEQRGSRERSLRVARDGAGAIRCDNPTLSGVISERRTYYAGNGADR
jgi:hypothetical protein